MGGSIMDLNQALDMLDQVAQQVQLGRKEHLSLIQAVNVLRKDINKVIKEDINKDTEVKEDIKEDIKKD